MSRKKSDKSPKEGRLVVARKSGVGLDLMVTFAGKRHGFEFKNTDAPGRTRSMHIVVEEVGLEHLWVIYPGDRKYTLDHKITVIPLEKISQFAGGAVV